ncbi:mitochondrial ribosomal protein L55 [Megalopta genalis]|uniref:mitochondrial ribosomal protein L55 n=1 Tax=Megalopta genalis TaxID=115081 RepID=UPI003FD5A596
MVQCRSVEERMNVSPLLQISLSAVIIRRSLNCWTTGITKKHRKFYMRTYPTHLVYPDGSTIIIEYHEPREIIKLPLDIETLSKEGRLQRLAGRKTLSKVVVEKEEDLDFDENKYFKKKL